MSTPPVRKAKIVATIGPASSSEETLLGLIKAGVDVFRLNFSHGDHDFFRKTVATIRKLEKKQKTHVAILQDLQGPKIRTGPLKGDAVEVAKGSTWSVTPDGAETTPTSFSISYRELLKDAQAGQTILVDDGKLRFEIESKDETALQVKAAVAGELSGNKGVHFPRMNLTASSLTEKDFVDLNVGLELDIDYIALSFVRRPQDVKYLKDFLQGRQKSYGIIAKIEREEAVENIDAIIEEADGIMVARGDMAVELGPENVPLIQKTLIEKCNSAAKPVITATEMLLSMVHNATPTRAEASDVANAIMDGTDAVMLSNETAMGDHPVTAVEMMDQIVRQTESQWRETKRTQKDEPASETPPQIYEVDDAVVCAATHIAEAVEAKLILSVSQSGKSPRLYGKYRPVVDLYAVVNSEEMCRRLRLCWGVETLYLPDYPTSLDFFDRLLNEAQTRGLASKGDKMVISAGLPDILEKPTNMVHVLEAR